MTLATATGLASVGFERLPPPHPQCDLITVIPVRNEEALLPDCLDALLRQQQLDRTPLNAERYEILVLVNNTTDRSLGVASDFAARHPDLRLHVIEATLPSQAAHVGAARRLIMDAAYERFNLLAKPHGIIASTDGDTRVTPNWVAATIEAVANGAEAVGGRILFRPNDLRRLPLNMRLPYLRDVSYRHLAVELEARLDPVPGDPLPRHFQNFGASMAVTAQAYERVGGLPANPFLEDVALFEALERIDTIVRHSPSVRVYTSARLTGKTSFGLAAQLREWGAAHDAGKDLMVPSAAAIERRIIARARLRSIWMGHGESEDLLWCARQLGVAPDELRSLASRAEAFGALWQDIQHAGSTAHAENDVIPIDLAIQQLRQRLAGLRAAQRPRSSGPLSQTDRAGTEDWIAARDVATLPSHTLQRVHGPDRRSVDIRSRLDASAPAADGLSD